MQTAAPSPLAAFRVTETAARAKILEEISGGGDLVINFMAVIRTGYDHVPAASRGSATTAAFNWLKTFVSSPAFATSYAKFRAEHKPDGPAPAPAASVDEQARKQVADLIGQMEESKKLVVNLPAADRPAALSNIDKMIAEMRKPEYTANLRMGLELQARGASDSAAKDSAAWNTNWPESLSAFVRPSLERFMAMTATLDYSIAVYFVKNPSGETIGFLSPGLTSITWEAACAIVAGKPAMDAARAVIDAWLKTLK